MFLKMVLKALETMLFITASILKRLQFESVTYIDDVGVGYLDLNEENVISKDLVIVAKKGSAAEKYARDNGFKVENN